MMYFQEKLVHILPFWGTFLNFGDFRLVDSTEQPIGSLQHSKKVHEKYDSTGFDEFFENLNGFEIENCSL